MRPQMSQQLIKGNAERDGRCHKREVYTPVDRHLEQANPDPPRAMVQACAQPVIDAKADAIREAPHGRSARAGESERRLPAVTEGYPGGHDRAGNPHAVTE